MFKRLSWLTWVVLAGCSSTNTLPSISTESVELVSAAVGGAVQIDCGSTGSVAPFAADEDFAGGATINHANTIDTSKVINPAPAAVYQTARIGNFTYTIAGFSAGSSATVRLHFAETYFSAAGSRVFSVSINGASVLADFDIIKTAGAKNRAYIAQFNEAANSSGAYVIKFTSVVNNSLISGIEIVPRCMPGTTQCLGNAVQVCGSNGQWGMTSACPNGQSCVSGACTTAMACMPGTTQCSGNAVQVCGSNGQWGMPTACPNGQSCANGACGSATACMRGQTQCSGNAVQVCDSNGQWGMPTACTNGQSCVGGTCTTAVACMAGTTQCSGNAVQVCDANGQMGHAHCVPQRSDLRRRRVHVEDFACLRGGLF